RIALYWAPTAVGAVDFVATLREALLFFSLGRTVPSEPWTAVALGFLGVAALGVWFVGPDGHRLPRWFRHALVLGYALAPVALAFLVSQVRPMFQTRYFLVSGPAFSLALALGLVGLYRRARPLGAAVGILLLGSQAYSLHNYFFDERYVKAEFPQGVKYVLEHLRPGDGILLDGWGMRLQFWYYYTVRADEPAPAYVFPLDPPRSWEENLQAVDRAMANHPGVWFLDYAVQYTDPDRVIEKHLASAYYQALYQPVGRHRVVYYATAPPTPPTTVRLDVRCGDDLVIEEFTSYHRSVRAGEIVPLALRLRAARQPAQAYGVSWRLLDAAGRVVVQRDDEPVSGFRPTLTWRPGEAVVDRYGMVVPEHLPPGRYAVVAVVYDERTGTPCSRYDDGGPGRNGSLHLLDLTVEDAPPVASLATPPPAHPADFRFGGLDLLGFDAPPGPLRPGDSLTVTLRWRVREAVERDYQVTARLVTTDGRVVHEHREPLGGPSFPTSRWHPGRTVSTPLTVPIPPRTDVDTLKLALTLHAVGIGERDFDGVPPVPVITRQRTFTTGTVPRPLQATFGEAVDLLGYDLQTVDGWPLTPGHTLRLRLWWQARREMETSYKVFVHLVGGDGAIYGQRDAVPMDGNAPTNSWIPGEVVVDEYQFTISPRASPGVYYLLVGLYDPRSGDRLPLVDGSGDHVTLTSLPVAEG
ncbi:MAG TPA: hypothetical protein VIN09_08180, partial [Chloroflexota bacterium]